MKLLTFTVPCYNSAEYMDNCIRSLLVHATVEEVEIIIVDDGSRQDDTPEKADEWARREPGIIRAIHQENGGHGAAVMTGVRSATGRYFKVVDSDDWLDADAYAQMLEVLRTYSDDLNEIDLLITNYVYEHVVDGTRMPIRYGSVLPKNRVFDWRVSRRFLPSQNLLMHSLTYRTQVLRDAHLELPRHTFYVDNIYAYVPLPYCRRLYYLDVDLYRYFIGREDQSVNERIMIERIDQQLRVTRIMIDAVDLEHDVESKQLRNYMKNYLTMMMTVCSVFTVLSGRPDRLELRDDIWDYLKQRDEKLYYEIRRGIRGMGSFLPGRLGRKVFIGFYHFAQRIFKFN
ncbi:MAG: glycosyltransferase family 2 protein [Coriobacteriales bacterium]